MINGESQFPFPSNNDFRNEMVLWIKTVLSYPMFQRGIVQLSDYLKTDGRVKLIDTKSKYCVRMV